MAILRHAPMSAEEKFFILTKAAEILESGDFPDSPLALRCIPIPPDMRHLPVVYYLSSNNTDVVKIGTTVNMSRRFQSMKSSATGLTPRLLAWEYGGMDIELERHMDFGRDSRIRTDWFALTPRLREHILSIRTAEFPKEDPKC